MEKFFVSEEKEFYRIDYCARVEPTFTNHGSDRECSTFTPRPKGLPLSKLKLEKKSTEI
jgi:hypothetical protein